MSGATTVSLNKSGNKCMTSISVVIQQNKDTLLIKFPSLGVSGCACGFSGCACGVSGCACGCFRVRV